MQSSQLKMPSWMMSMVEYYKQRGKINLLASMTAAEGLVDSHDENMRVQRAENDYYIRQLGGTQESRNEGEEGDMRTTILGDVNNPPPVVVNKESSLLGPLAAMALGALIPGTGVAGYFVSQYLADKAPAVVNEIIDGDDVNLGLGRIEDYE